jgi:outer membrane protein assembly factor BamB
MSGRKYIATSSGLLPAVILLVGFPALAGDWPSGRHDSANTASIRIVTSPQVLPSSWTFESSSHIWGYQPGMSVWSSAAVGLVEGRPVVAVGSYDRNIYLLDACSGKKIWRYTTGAGVYGAPLIWHDKDRQWIFVASSDRLVYGLDAALGSRQWSTQVEDYRPTLGGARLSAPAVGQVKDRPAVFVGHWVWDKSLSNNLQAGGLTALDARSGKKLWRTDFLDNRVSEPIYVDISGRGWIFVASQDGNLRALDADSGRVLWFHRETEMIMGSPAYFDGKIVIGSHFGKVRCLNAETGAEIWSFKTGNWVTASPAIYRQADKVVVAVGSFDQRMYALDLESGQKIWSSPVAGPIYSSAAIVDKDEPNIVFSAWDHSLHIASGRHGTLLYSIYTGEPIWDAINQGDSNWSSPVVAKINRRWMIYFGSYNGTFYAMPLDQVAQVGPSMPWSNLSFWIGMLVAMAVSVGFGFYFSKRRRPEV